MIALGLLLASLAAAAAPAEGQEGGLVLFGIGWFNVGGARDPAQFDLEWRGRPRKLGLQINAGAMVNGDEGAYAFGGLRRDFALGKHWGLSLGLGVGLWHTGDGLDLGGPVQFRSALEFFVHPTRRSRLALSFYHLSNADIYDENPGSNSIVLLYGRRLK